MMLPPSFVFSQNNLQDYLDCPRRFQLLHLQHLAWPAVKTEPYLVMEKRILQGEKFHNLVRQAIAGVPPEILASQIEDVELEDWWEAWLSYIPSLPQGKRLSEYSLSIPMLGYRLMARYDLIIASPPNTLTIVDWKTNHKRPSSKVLGSRLQSRIYPLVAIQAGLGLFPGSVHVEVDRLIYWFTAFPDQPESIPYSSESTKDDNDYLLNLINEILHCNESDFPLTEDERLCRFCVYRSYCRRGDKAGKLEEIERDDELFLDATDLPDFDQINPIDL